MRLAVIGKLCHQRAQATVPLLPLGCWSIFKRPVARNGMWWEVKSCYSVIIGFNEKYILFISIETELKQCWYL